MLSEGALMSKEYTFEFFGTKEEFMRKIVPNGSYTYSPKTKVYYIDAYMISISGDEILFGIQRAGHSGGYWYAPTITESDDRIVFSGKIKYIGPEDHRSKPRKAVDKIFDICFTVLFSPLMLFLQLLVFVVWLVQKIAKHSDEPLTKEGCLFTLMEKHLCCVRK